MTNIEDILKSRFPDDVVNELIKAYKEIESNFIIGKWKASELDAGHFVEAVRRILEFELTGKYTPISEKISSFSDAAMKKYEQGSGDESFRILIPRAVMSIYSIRNKRGVGHISNVSPSRMDATYVLYAVKWVLAELIRIAANIPPDQTQEIIDGTVERQIELLWEHDGITRVLDNKIKAREQVLILLYDKSPRSDVELQASIEYKNATNFRKILKRLHDSRLIEYAKNGDCILTSTGIREAELEISTLLEV